MKLKIFALSALVAVAVVGCDQNMPAAKKPDQTHWTKTPALPIIQDAVSSLVPTFNGQQAPVLVNQLCAMAQGAITQAQNNAQLTTLGIDATKLTPTAKDAVALLVNGDKAGQATACAAYQAMVVMSPLSPGDILHEVKVPVAQAAKVEKGDKADKGQKKETVATETRQVIDQEATNRLFRLRIAQVRASADTYAYIAERLAETPGLTLAQYQEKARTLFSSMAPSYLQLVQRYLPPAATQYRLEQLDELGTAFSSDAGMRYKVSRSDGLIFTQNGQIWLGAGYIMGNDYRVQATYFVPAAQKNASAQK